MDIIDVAILLGICFVFCLFTLCTYTLGLRNGQKLTKSEEIIMPNLNPVTAINKHIENQEQKKEQEEWDKYIEAFEAYDGRL